MNQKIIFATGNQDKMKEIKDIMSDIPYEVISMKEAGIMLDIEEDGESFEENALIKAKSVALEAGKMGLAECIVLADDSGLEIDCLNKEPGIFSARYMGEGTSYQLKNANLIQRTNETGDKDRKARFVCAIAAIFPDGTNKVLRGTIEGQVADQEYGSNGFGYDPIFYVPEFGCTTAQLSEEEKNKCSHRGRALQQMKKEILIYESTNNQ